MKRTVEFVNYSGGRYGTIKVELQIPNKCPVCSTAYGDEPIKGYRHDHRNGRYGFRNSTAIYFCPHCEYLFNVNYNVYEIYTGLYSAEFVDSYPIAKYQTEFSDALATLSPSFIEIYHQAETAEAQGLSEICGMGYRKALEFLVKDFACRMNPDKVEEIQSMQLSPCINKYIEFPKIKALSIASIWLGNDETHYVRHNVEYDIEDLKLFIKSIVAFIESELTYLEAEALIESKKKTK